MALADYELVTRQIRQALDIVDVVGEHVALKRAGREFLGLCPFHDDSRPSLNVSPHKQIFKCFACGAGGDVFKFVQLREKLTFPEARRLLARRAGVHLDERPAAPRSGPSREAIAEANAWAARFFTACLKGPDGGRGREYLAGRQINDDSIEAFKLGYAPDRWDGLLRQATAERIATGVLVAAGLIKPRPSGDGHYDTFRNRLIFPIVDAGGRIVAFGGRTLGDDPAKYLNSAESPLFEKSSTLYGLDRARAEIARRGEALVVEGYTDCLMAHQFGLTHAVATLGTALTPGHVGLLRRYAERITLVFDSDQAGLAAADRALETFLAHQVEVRLAHVPEGKDPCDFLLTAGAEPFEVLMTQAVEALEYKWSRFEAGYAGTPSPATRSRAVAEFIDLLVRTGGLDARRADRNLARHLMLDRLAHLVSMRPDELERLFQAAKGRAGRRTGPAALATRDLPAAGDRVAAATRQVLEVLLCEPSYFVSVADHFDPQALGDDDLRAVGHAVVRLCDQYGRFELTDLLGQFDDPRFGRLVTDLAEAGERRGNHGATIEGAVECLQRCRKGREAAQAARAAIAGQTDEEELRRNLIIYQQHGSRRSGFAAPKFIVPVPPTPADGSDVGASRPPDQTR